MGVLVINKYRVRIGFDMAAMQGVHESDKLCLELNQLFHDTLKAWAKDREVLVTPTRTTMEGEPDAN